VRPDGAGATVVRSREPRDDASGQARKRVGIAADQTPATLATMLSSSSQSAPRSGLAACSLLEPLPASPLD